MNVFNDPPELEKDRGNGRSSVAKLMRLGDPIATMMRHQEPLMRAEWTKDVIDNTSPDSSSYYKSYDSYFRGKIDQHNAILLTLARLHPETEFSEPISYSQMQSQVVAAFDKYRRENLEIKHFPAMRIGV